MKVSLKWRGRRGRRKSCKKRKRDGWMEREEEEEVLPSFFLSRFFFIICLERERGGGCEDGSRFDSCHLPRMFSLASSYPTSLPPHPPTSSFPLLPPPPPLKPPFSFLLLLLCMHRFRSCHRALKAFAPLERVGLSSTLVVVYYVLHSSTT